MAKSGLELNSLRGLESNLGISNQLLAGSVLFGNAGQFKIDYQRILAVTTADVKRLAGTYLSGPRIVLSVVPRGKKDQASKAAESETVTMVQKQVRGGRS
jgi:predicted Zn-dependent peptidase